MPAAAAAAGKPFFSAPIAGSCRNAKFAHPRAIAVQLIRQFTKASYPLIGREMGRRHHSTIITLERRAHNLIGAFPELYDRRQAILVKLGL